MYIIKLIIIPYVFMLILQSSYLEVHLFLLIYIQTHYDIEEYEV